MGRCSSLCVCVFCGDEDCSLRLLLCSCSVTEELAPFSREIQPEELWLYKFHPVKQDRVPTRFMFVSAYNSCSAMEIKLNITCKRDDDNGEYHCCFSLINFLKQSIALFTPLLVIFLFALLKKGGKGDVKEASLGKKCVNIIYCIIAPYSKKKYIYIYISK